MAMMAAVGGLISGVASMAGAAASASAQREEAERVRQAGEYNAREYKINAAIEQSRGAGESEKEGLKGKQAVARQRAAMAQAGLTTDTGTPLLLQEETVGRTKYNQSVAMFEGLTRQRGNMARAEITKFESETQARSLENRAQATLLSGFASGVGSIGKAFG